MRQSFIVSDFTNNFVLDYTFGVVGGDSITFFELASLFEGCSDYYLLL